MVDMNPGAPTARPPDHAFPYTVLFLVPPSVQGSGTGPRRKRGGQGGVGMSGQCVPFISVSPVASTAPGTERLSINVCEVQAREQLLP